MGNCCSSQLAEQRAEEVERAVGLKHRYISFDTRVAAEWKEADKNHDNRLTLKEIKAMLHKLNARVPDKILKRRFKQHDKDKSGDLDFDEFRQLFEEVSSLPNIEEIFQKAAGGEDTMVANELQRFLQSCTGGDSMLTPLECALLIAKYEGGTQADLEEVEAKYQEDMDSIDESPTLTSSGFARLLTSVEDNCVFRPSKTSVYQDMSQPLSHYFISSSHNTYLSGNQLNSDSTVEAIRHALLSGVRVVELDSWDGHDGMPHVTHGHTLCKPVPFRDCIMEIKESAFKITDYPVIVTIENHCSIEQQSTQVEILRRVLGSSLYAWVGAKDSKGQVDWSLGPPEFISPEELRGRIVIRDKPKTKAPTQMAEDVKDAAKPVELSLEQLASSDDEHQEEPEQEQQVFKVSEELLKLMYIKNIKLKPVISHHEAIYPDPPYASSSSLGEKKMLKLAKPGHTAKALCLYAQKNLVRVFPKGSRVDSSNYDPTPAWNAGCQVVALNYQTNSMPKWLNTGKFTDNGCSGYVLKPDFMLANKGSDSWDATTSNVTPRKLVVKLLSGHYLPKPLGEGEKTEVIDPYVEVSLHGLSKQQKLKTEAVNNNGFNPTWNATFRFDVYEEDLDLLAFVVKDKDFGQDDFIGQYVLPLRCLRPGFRVVPLKFANGAPMDYSYLFAEFQWEM